MELRARESVVSRALRAERLFLASSCIAMCSSAAVRGLRPGPAAGVGAAVSRSAPCLTSALDKHAVVVRGVGEMASEREGFISEKEMLTYEALVNMTIKRFPCVVICQYDVRKFSGQVVLEALRAHPDVMNFPLGPLLK